MATVNIFWFRRDLRLHDNAGLYHALKAGKPVVPIFIFDKKILDLLEEKKDPRVTFIHEAINDLQAILTKAGSTLDVRYGNPEQVFKDLLETYEVENVFTNHDYEPYAIERDAAIQKMLKESVLTKGSASHKESAPHTESELTKESELPKESALLKESGIGFKTYKDQVIFDRDEIIKDDGRPYTVFTPYSKRWLATLNDFYLEAYPSEAGLNKFYKQPHLKIASLENMGFIKTEQDYPTKHPEEALIIHYDKHRDIPGMPGTSRLGVHLRFGTISIRELAKKARSLNDVYLKELIWRDFYHMILWHFPKVGKGHAFKIEYEKIKWRNDENEFEKWCAGNTGYPIVDAGMRELNTTGFMHNRVRMIVASFLCKHLLIDWRWGEAYFAGKLLDFDLASNNGGWQWASGSGCDSAPYFRIFNPYLQTKKFDPEFKYLRRWVPEFEEFTYPLPIIEHEAARKRCLEVYSETLKKP